MNTQTETTRKVLHTQGQWRQGYSRETAVVSEVDGKIITICHTYIDNTNFVSKEQATANAKLISLAPRMLSTLRELKIMIEKWEEINQESFNSHMHIDAHINLDKILKELE